MTSKRDFVQEYIHLTELLQEEQYVKIREVFQPHLEWLRRKREVKEYFQRQLEKGGDVA